MRSVTRLIIVFPCHVANWGAELENYPDDAWTKVITLNVQRVFTLTQKLQPLLLAGVKSVQTSSGEKIFEDPARIINIGSVDGLRVPNLETYAYSSSKAALHHLSRVLAAQLGPQGITSNTLACGPFESKSTYTPTRCRPVPERNTHRSNDPP